MKAHDMPKSQDICITDLLSNLADELVDLASMAAGFDEVVGDWVSDRTTVAQMNPAVLQSIDLFRQRMDCIARLSQNLAEQTMAPNRLDADALSEGVYLETVRRACLKTPAEHPA